MDPVISSIVSILSFIIGFILGLVALPLAGRLHLDSSNSQDTGEFARAAPSKPFSNWKAFTTKQKRAPKVNNDQKAWAVENNREV